MTRTVIGIFSDREHADHAVEQLEVKKFNPKDISVVMKSESDVGETTDAVDTMSEGAISGATTGGVVGGLAGLLVGIGAITLPGIGAFLIGGPLAAALGLTGAAAATVAGAVTGAAAGGLLGALVGLGVPEEDARVYESRVKSGAILVAVPVTDANEDDARTILEENNAEQVRTVSSATT